MRASKKTYLGACLLVIAVLLCGKYVIEMAFTGLYGTELRQPLLFRTQPSPKTIMSMSHQDAITLQNTIKDSIKTSSVEYDAKRPSDVTIENTTLTLQEQQRLAKCVETGPRDKENNGSRFWDASEIRWTHHTYLNKEGAVVLDIGGNRGKDALEFVKRYNPRWYVILEPLEVYYHHLEKMFANNPSVTLFNLGVGQKEEVMNVLIEGHKGDATSKFSKANVSEKTGKAVPIYITNATAFLTKIGVGTVEVDLVTINCEGCEFETLETMLSSGLVRYFKNIQFATHTTLPMLKDPFLRYCRIQEVLSRTHHPTYQYKFIWETWRRNGL